MSTEEYFNLTEKAKNYPVEAWADSDDVLMYAVPSDEGMSIMSMYEAMCFIANNDAGSMIALRIPKSDYNSNFEDPEQAERYGIEIKDSYYVDYQGKNLI